MSKVEVIFNELLKAMVLHKASDLYIKPLHEPVLRIEGELYPVELSEQILPNFTEEILDIVSTPSQRKSFETNPEMNIIYSIPEFKDRFRINLYKNKGYVSLVIRRINSIIPTIEDLNLPSILKKFVLYKRGLVIVCGPTGTGKSTTLASMLDFVNQNYRKHIVTIEDPIEYIIEDKKSYISQREVGIDTNSFADALKSVVRQTPDIVMVGETRDRITATSILQLAETGHLILTTLHSPNTVQAIVRILQFFDQSEHREIVNYLSSNLIAVISQRLLPRIDNKGRVPIVEILIMNARMQELLMEMEFKKMKAEIESFLPEGMQSFDISILKLYAKGLISLETALEYAEVPHDLQIKIRTLGIKPGKELPEDLQIF
ncbi:MAG: PilT/PilU family type 4a pilus ATPase [Candidatus Calescibacterium sp.]|nr:PilT/PilU family type 4a pilus ATPase [Candidatus Calescibacterium sp.]MCX7971852.1 PilT/PilU family type 4a pilus ATPase [bacterium]MDW8195049.1 PilT/PilU family type 4a pilus ATPase [Candidatus Calescibacterium sp.]